MIQHKHVVASKLARVAIKFVSHQLMQHKSLDCLKNYQVCNQFCPKRNTIAKASSCLKIYQSCYQIGLQFYDVVYGLNQPQKLPSKCAINFVQRGILQDKHLVATKLTRVAIKLVCNQMMEDAGFQFASKIIKHTVDKEQINQMSIAQKSFSSCTCCKCRGLAKQ